MNNFMKPQIFRAAKIEFIVIIVTKEANSQIENGWTFIKHVTISRQLFHVRTFLYLSGICVDCNHKQQE